MKIAIDKDTQLAYYKGDLEMKDYLHGQDFIDTRMTPDNCELIDISEIPIAHWLGGGRLKYNGSTFDLTEEGEAEILFTLKKAKRAEMKSKRNDAISGVITVNILGNEYTVDCDLASRSAIHQVIDNAELADALDSTVNWKLADNTYQDFTIGDIKMIAIQMSMFIQAQYNLERDRSLEIDSATMDNIGDIQWQL